MSIRHPLGEVIAQALELAKVEHPRLASLRAHPAVHRNPAEGLGEEARQLPLQATDLTPQLATGEQLVGIDVKKCVPVEQIGHFARCRV